MLESRLTSTISDLNDKIIALMDLLSAMSCVYHSNVLKYFNNTYEYIMELQNCVLQEDYATQLLFQTPDSQKYHNGHIKYGIFGDFIRKLLFFKTKLAKKMCRFNSPLFLVDRSSFVFNPLH